MAQKIICANVNFSVANPINKGDFNTSGTWNDKLGRLYYSQSRSGVPQVRVRVQSVSGNWKTYFFLADRETL